MLFIIGNPRSGTSLFRLLLTSHHDIHIPPECGFMLWWQDKYGNWEASDNDIRIDSFVADFFKSKKVEFWNLDPDGLKQVIRSQRPATYAELCTVIYRYHSELNGQQSSQYLGDKNNFHINHVTELYGLYPDAKFIHIIRDGRDVATSYMSMNQIESASNYRPNLPSEIEKIAAQWRSNVKAVRGDFAHLPVSQKFEIRYEDLVERSAETLQSVCEFLNVPYQSEMLEFYILNRNKDLEPDEFKAWKGRTFSEIDNSAVGKYLQLPKSDIERFEAVASDMLETYNYSLMKQGQQC